jgi:sulfur carrier protein
VIALTVNGRRQEAPEGVSVFDLVGRLGLRADNVAVERNGEALVRSDFETVFLGDGDRLEIVKAVAGG